MVMKITLVSSVHLGVHDCVSVIVFKGTILICATAHRNLDCLDSAQIVGQVIGLLLRLTRDHLAQSKAQTVKGRDGEVSSPMSLPDEKQAQRGNIGDYQEGKKEDAQKGQGSQT